MEFQFAPMEGITYGMFRKLHHQMFPGTSEYYTPFIAPDQDRSFKPKYLRELTMDREEYRLIPQLLVNRAEAFNITADKLHDLGFDEINLNAGCPSGTVYAKYKGSGMLRNLTEYDQLLDKIFSHAAVKGVQVSIKTRLGIHTTDEFRDLLNIYNRYPVKRLIIHARTRDGYYKSAPDLEAFAEAVGNSRIPVSYNGNVYSRSDLDKVLSLAPNTKAVMIGRGMIRNPALIRELAGGDTLKAEELRTFHDALTESWLESGLSPSFTVERMKSLWSYMQDLFPQNRREIKAIMKARTLADYRAGVSVLFSDGILQLSNDPML